MSISEINLGFKLGPISITNTMVWTWLVMLILTVLFLWLGAGAQLNPKGTKQTVAELIVEFINNLVRSTMGSNKMLFAPYILALFSFLLLSNLSVFLFLGFVRPPTADWATTLAMSVLSFSLIQGFGIKTNGIWEYVKGLADPIPLLLPLNIIGEVAPIISLSFRLFGNILGGLIIGTLVYSIYISGNAVFIWTVTAGVAIIFAMRFGLLEKFKNLPKGKKKLVGWVGAFACFPTLAIAFVHFYFDLFSGVMQAYIFTMLTMMFIANKIPDEWNAGQ